MTTKEIIDGIIKREGGYVDHPADRGGPTKFGITLATLEAWRGHRITAAYMKDLRKKTPEIDLLLRVSCEARVRQDRKHFQSGS